MSKSIPSERALLLLCAVMLAMVTQANDPEHLHYRLRVGINLRECEPNGRPMNEMDTPPDGAKFTLAGQTAGDSLIIRFWNWRRTDGTKDSTRILENELYVRFNERTIEIQTLNDKAKEVTVQRYFLLSKSDFARFAEPLAPRVAPLLGAATVPFKWRPQRGAFNDGLTISAMGGWELSIDRDPDHSIGLVLGLGVATVEYDSTSTYEKPLEVSQPAAVSFSIGALYQWQRLQIMALVGWDMLQGPQRTNWVYHGRPWIGLGIGAAIFSASEGAVHEKAQKLDD
jgi:hypothetical protein